MVHSSALTIPLRRRVLLRSKRLLRSIVVIYLLVTLVFALFQIRLIFPGASTQGTPDSVVSPPPGSELVHLTTAAPAAIPVVGLFCKARLPDGSLDPAASTKPTLLYFYGNGMCLNDALDECAQFTHLGANVFAVDYPGYGMSGGSPSEQNCYAAAEAAYRYVLTRPDIDAQQLIPAGWSLGGAVAIDLAARHADDSSPPHIAGIMTFSTFTSMADVGQYHYPIFPVSLLLTQRFDSLEKIGRIHVPLLIGHGGKDPIAPFAMSDRLAKAAGGPVARLSCATAGHNDFFDTAEDAVNRAVSDFLGRVEAGRKR